MYCEDCLEDDALKEYVRTSGEYTICFTCNGDNVPCVGVDDLFDHMVRCICLEWEDPLDIIGREREWNKFVTRYDSEELLDSVDGPFANKELSDQFAARYQNQWCKRNPLRFSTHEAMLYSWSLFCDIVRADSDMTGDFQDIFEDEEELIVPDLMLDELGKTLGAVEEQIVKTIASGHLCRARCHLPEESPAHAAELGSPPACKATNSRMSPAGVSMFYAAETEHTAIAEVNCNCDEAITTGRWRSCRPITYIDLLATHHIPSIFDRNRREERIRLLFLSSFAINIAEPLVDDDDLTQYIPTQMVTEYIQNQYLTSNGKYIDAIRYRSSIDDGGICWVVFADQSGCVDECLDDESVMVLDSTSVERYESGNVGGASTISYNTGQLFTSY